MKKLLLLVLLAFSTTTIFAQFANVDSLKQFITDTIKDRRPAKVTAAEVQKAFLGVTQFLVPTKWENKVNAGLSNYGDPSQYIHSKINFLDTIPGIDYYVTDSMYLRSNLAGFIHSNSGHYVNRFVWTTIDSVDAAGSNVRFDALYVNPDDFQVNMNNDYNSNTSHTVENLNIYGGAAQITGQAWDDGAAPFGYGLTMMATATSAETRLYATDNNGAANSLIDLLPNELHIDAPTLRLRNLNASGTPLAWLNMDASGGFEYQISFGSDRGPTLSSVVTFNQNIFLGTNQDGIESTSYHATGGGDMTLNFGSTFYLNFQNTPILYGGGDGVKIMSAMFGVQSIQILNSNTFATAADGAAQPLGSINYDDNYIYIMGPSGVMKRVALSTF